ncbi:MAG: DNA topoisomerase VI subunit B [Phycisphaerae bacterium]|nr:DNA topoisomerase VI subunit B [Phycisphaerae bacterium]
MSGAVSTPAAPPSQLGFEFETPARSGAEKPSTPREPARAASRRGASAETMAKQQREISVSEFFTKNRHLLGFDNKRKALLTTVKEAVDNSLDACEEAGILPDIEVRIEQTDEDRFRVTVRDNGPGIVKNQIPNVFGKLLYGSKFHRLKMSRGQQGIGISAAGMYGLITTGKPIRIVSRTGPRAEAHLYRLAIDTQKNKPDIISEETTAVDWPHGTEVSIELSATYQKGRASVDEYLELVAIANPHAKMTYHAPGQATTEFPRATEELPRETKEIKPHPHGIELGMLMKMLKQTESRKLGAFLQTEFCRVSPGGASEICAKAGLTAATWVNALEPPQIEKLYRALQEAKLKAPPTDCLAPIGAEAILKGLLKEIKAEFYTATTRDPAVYRGNPFQVEVGIAYGGELGRDMHELASAALNEGAASSEGGASASGKADDEDVQTRVIRYANRVPLLYQQSGCALYKSVVEMTWNNYGLSQSRGALPRAPMLILIHLASVWVPFTSEGKEAIADYDEIRKEVRLALAECGRKLNALLKRKRTRAQFANRRSVFTRYIDEVVEATRAMARVNKEELREALLKLSTRYTEQADMEFDEHGKVLKKLLPGNDLGLADTIVVDRSSDAPPAPETLFASPPAGGSATAGSSKRGRGARRKR